ncbi:hypothetical protein OH491_21565 [Termitidicoccus mucosus]|uniref:hypothetical protein n=1 Tax=Termitidicoccus mucosus TaxID=1184151 RepID=UPI0031832D0F
MTLVRIVKSWTWPDLLRQTPAGDGIWDECRFTLDPVERCDFLVALNHIPADLAVTVPPSRVWLFMQEPPERDYRWAERGFHHFSRIHTQDTRLRGPSIVQRNRHQ